MLLTDHARERMAARGVTEAEVEATIELGWPATDPMPGREGYTAVFAFDSTWEGRTYAEKEVTVYWIHEADRLVVLTVKSRYGKHFPRKTA